MTLKSRKERLPAMVTKMFITLPLFWAIFMVVMVRAGRSEMTLTDMAVAATDAINLFDQFTHISMAYVKAVAEPNFDVNELGKLDVDEDLHDKLLTKIAKGSEKMNDSDRQSFRSACYHIFGIFVVIEYSRQIYLASREIDNYLKEPGLKAALSRETRLLMAEAKKRMHDITDLDGSLYNHALNIIDAYKKSREMIAITEMQIGIKPLEQQSVAKGFDTYVYLEKFPGTKRFMTFVNRVVRYMHVMDENKDDFHISMLKDVRQSEEVLHETVEMIENMKNEDFGKVKLDEGDCITIIHRIIALYIIRKDFAKMDEVKRRTNAYDEQMISDVFHLFNETKLEIRDFVNSMLRDITQVSVLNTMFKRVEKLQIIVNYPSDGIGGPFLTLSKRQNQETQKRAALSHKNKMAAAAAASIGDNAESLAPSVNASMKTFNSKISLSARKFPAKLFARWNGGSDSDKDKSGTDSPASAKSPRPPSPRHLTQMLKKLQASLKDESTSSLSSATGTASTAGTNASTPATSVGNSSTSTTPVARTSRRSRTAPNEISVKGRQAGKPARVASKKRATDTATYDRQRSMRQSSARRRTQNASDSVKHA